MTCMYCGDKTRNENHVCDDCQAETERMAQLAEKEVCEVCPNCGEEITKKWDVEKQGYRATCPNCGEELMLCDACMNSDDNEGQYCDWSEERGCFRKPKETK